MPLAKNTPHITRTIPINVLLFNCSLIIIVAKIVATAGVAAPIADVFSAPILIIAPLKHIPEKKLQQ